MMSVFVCMGHRQPSRKLEATRTQLCGYAQSYFLDPCYPLACACARGWRSLSRFRHSWYDLAHAHASRPHTLPSYSNSLLTMSWGFITKVTPNLLNPLASSPQWWIISNSERMSCGLMHANLIDPLALCAHIVPMREDY